MIVYPSLPSGHVIFCDDIRREITGKVTFVGAYTQFLYINGTLPIILPKLCMGIVYRQERDALDPVQIKIFFPGNDEDSPVAVFEIEPQPDMIAPASEEFIFQEHRMFFETPPGIMLEHEGRIRVRAYRGDDEIRLGSLTIAVNPIVEQKEDAANEDAATDRTTDA